MASKKEKEDRQEQEALCPIVDKYSLVTKLRTLISESGNIAEYIDDNVHYGRALGYAEGRCAAYIDLAGRVVNGDFDPAFEIEEG